MSILVEYLCIVDEDCDTVPSTKPTHSTRCESLNDGYRQSEIRRIRGERIAKMQAAIEGPAPTLSEHVERLMSRGGTQFELDGLTAEIRVQLATLYGFEDHYVRLSDLRMLAESLEQS